MLTKFKECAVLTFQKRYLQERGLERYMEHKRKRSPNYLLA